MDFRRIITPAVAGLLLFAALSCGESTTEPPTPPPPPPPPPARPTTVSVSPSTAPLTALGKTVQLTAEVRDQNGQTMSTAVTWASGSEAVATVNSTGLVTAVANGTATITAAAGSASGTTAVTVAQIASAVAVSPPVDTLMPGDTLRLTAEATDANGHPVAEADFSWASGDPRVVRVDQNGLATGVSAGEAEIRAVAGEAGGEARVVVTDSVSSVCDRTPQVRDAIMSATGRTDCADVTAQDLASINTLDLAGPTKALSGTDCDVTEPNCRADLTAAREKAKWLRVPQASANAAGPEIHALLAGDFEGLSGLQHLWLQDNWLRDLPSGVFDDLENLDSVVLARNILTELPDGLFRNSPRLRAVDLSGNRLAGLPDGFLAENTSLQAVVLASNRLREFPEGFLDGSRRLTFVSLWGNTLEALPDGFLGEHTELRSVVLMRNRLKELPEHFLGAARGLEFVSLWANALEALPDSFLGDHPELGYCAVAFNKLRELPQGFLDASLGLYNVDLDGNALEALPDSFLGDHPELTYVGLGSNRLTELPEGFLGASRGLRTLRLYDNALEALPEGFFDGMPTLQTTYFDGNPGSPFALNLLLERVDNSDPLAPGPATLRLRVAEGAPFSIDASLSGLGRASLSAGEVRIEAGQSLSTEATVTVPGSPAGVEVETAVLAAGCEECRVTGLRLQAGPFMTLANPSEATVGIAGAYMTQAAQNVDGTVSLIAGRDALLRVFATGDVVSNYPITGHATFSDGRSSTQLSLVPPDGGIGLDVDEGRLGSSFNLHVPGELLRPHTTVSVRLVPGEGANLTAESELEITLAPDIREVAPLDVTIVPVQYGWWRNATANEAVAEFSRDLVERDSEDQLRFTRKFLPISSLNLSLRDPYITFADTTRDGGIGLLGEIELLRHVEVAGTDQYYHGLLAFPNFRGPGWGFGGVAANIPAYTALTISHLGDGTFRGDAFGETFAHELGHDVNLRHAPGCGAGGPDRNYPHAEATIGVWGYDVAAGVLKHPATFDYMSYCEPTWVSDYFFARSLDHLTRPGRGVAAFQAPTEEALILWGNIQDGRLLLEPPLALEAPVKRPERSGPYRITALDRDGRTLFSFDFAPDATDHAGETFLFAVPFEEAWTDGLDRITLSGPEGSTTVRRGAIDRTAVVVDGAGRVRSILRDWSGDDLLPELDGLSLRRLRERR